MTFSALVNDYYTIILLALAGVGFVALALYYGLVCLRCGVFKRWHPRLRPQPVAEAGGSGHVSVVLTSHNEAAYLKDNLVYLLEQDYPDLEVVVVDYTSEDDTKFVLRVCGENYNNLKPVEFREDINSFRGKKYPLSIGIQSAKDGIILLTDPDCRPASFNWVREMAASYHPSTQMVLGYTGIKAGTGLLNILAQYDNVTHTAHYISAALAGRPYTGNGRNLSYRRGFFFDKGAFIKHYSVPDGADDLFVNANATRSNTVVNVERDAWTEVEPYASMRQWQNSRRHRFATKKYYPLGQLLGRMVPPAALCLFVAALVAAVVHMPALWPVAVGAVVVKCAWQIVCYAKLCKRFEVKKVYPFAPLLELYFLVADTIMFISTLKRGKHHR
ncbi:MAG: glycosyltransferase [Bacteroidales bacterium]|nr:glycosyltransferase [Bacteroidales bacterium]